MYSKLGRTLAQTNKYDVNIIGFASKNLPEDAKVSFWPLFNFNRISVKRLLAPLRYLQKLIQLKPEVVIVTSPDLLLVSAAYKILFGSQLIYDVQENYTQNILWSHGTSGWLPLIRAKTISFTEKVTSRMIVHFILAEKCYINECSFISEAITVLENKVYRPQVPLELSDKKRPLRLLYSGTVAESYGIFDSLSLAARLYKVSPDLQYIICGHCPSEAVYRRLLNEAEQHPWLQLKISLSPVPYSQIEEELRRASYVLVAYQLNPSNEHCFPTRIWEALAWQVPMLLRKEHPWRSLVQEYKAGLAVDFLSPTSEDLQAILQKDDYYPFPLPESIYWESEQAKLLKLMNIICSKS